MSGKGRGLECTALGLSPWPSSMTLGLSFLTRKMGETIHGLQVSVRITRNKAGKGLGPVLRGGAGETQYHCSSFLSAKQNCFP